MVILYKFYFLFQAQSDPMRKDPDTESDSSAALSNADSGRGSNEDTTESTEHSHSRGTKNTLYYIIIFKSS